MKNISIKEVVDKLVVRCKELGNGSVSSTHDLVDELKEFRDDIEFEPNDLMDIHAMLFEECNKQGINLDMSAANDMIIGNPYDISFKITYKDPNEIDESGYIPNEYLK